MPSQLLQGGGVNPFIRSQLDILAALSNKEQVKEQCNSIRARYFSVLKQFAPDLGFRIIPCPATTGTTCIPQEVDNNKTAFDSAFSTYNYDAVSNLVVAHNAARRVQSTASYGEQSIPFCGAIQNGRIDDLSGDLPQWEGDNIFSGPRSLR